MAVLPWQLWWCGVAPFRQWRPCRWRRGPMPCLVSFVAWQGQTGLGRCGCSFLLVVVGLAGCRGSLLLLAVVPVSPGTDLVLWRQCVRA